MKIKYKNKKNEIIYLLPMATHMQRHLQKREHLHHLLSWFAHVLNSLMSRALHSVLNVRDVWLSMTQLNIDSIYVLPETQFIPNDF